MAAVAPSSEHTRLFLPRLPVQAVLESCPNPRNGVYSAPAAKLAALAQNAPGVVLQQLRDMAAGSLIGFELSRDEGPAYVVRRRLVSIAACMSASRCMPWLTLLSCCAQILRTPADLDSLAQQVHDRLAAVLACQVARLDVAYRALHAAVLAGQAASVEQQPAAQEAALRAAVERYFDAGRGEPVAGTQAPCGDAASGSNALMLDTDGLPLKRAEPALLQAARAVLRRNREQAGPCLSARALARILHGVSSPGYPADAWGKRMGAFWGSQAHVDFGAVLKAAEIVVRNDD